jgi:hypothetical protein
MGYIDNVADGSFKTTGDGNVLFYPYGVWGKGYVIPNIEKKQEIRKRLKRLHFFTLAVLIPVVSLAFPAIRILLNSLWITVLIFIVAIAGLSLAEYVFRKQFAKGLTPVDEKLTVWEVMQDSAKSQSIIFLLVFEIISLLFTVASIWVMINTNLAWYFRLNGVVGFLIFGFCCIVFGYIISLKNKK